MEDAKSKIEALENRVTRLESELVAAREHAAKFKDWVHDMDLEYQKMMRAALHKYGVCLEFIERAGPLVLECHNALFPTKTEKTRKDLSIFARGSEKIN